MIYISGWAFSYLCLLCVSIFTHWRRFATVAAILPFAFIAAFRGDVGTDTVSYQWILGSLSSGSSIGLEPGFSFVSQLLLELFSAEVSVRFFSFFYFGFLIIYAIRSSPNERYFLLSYILPVFSYYYSMNILRVGMAAGIFLLISQSIARSPRASEYAKGLSSVAFHYSSVLYLLFTYITQRSVSKVSSWVAIILGGAFIFLTYYFVELYFIEKFNLYVVHLAPSVLSGLGIVIPVLFILVMLSFGSLPAAEKFKLIVLGVSCLLMAWILSRFSYAGLRVLEIFSFIVPVSIIVRYGQLNLPLGPKVKIGFLGAGLLSVVSIYMNFVGEEGAGPSPFLPYKFFWEQL